MPMVTQLLTRGAQSRTFEILVLLLLPWGAQAQPRSWCLWLPPGLGHGTCSLNTFLVPSPCVCVTLHPSLTLLPPSLLVYILFFL